MNNEEVLIYFEHALLRSGLEEIPKKWNFKILKKFAEIISCNKQKEIDFLSECLRESFNAGYQECVNDVLEKGIDVAIEILKKRQDEEKLYGGNE